LALQIAMSYGAIEQGEVRKERRKLGKGLAYGTLILAVTCVATLMAIASTRTTGRTTLLPATPGLKSLVGTFMKEQGASQKDMAAVNKYYSSKKATFQQLDDISGEFDPISDADSNYGRVLGIQSVSRTNGVVPEDMDVSPERKSRVQMLAMPDRFMLQKKIEKLSKDQGRFGTNKAFIGKFDGHGQSTKANVQMLSQQPLKVNVWNQIGVPEPHQAAQGAMQASDNFGYKARPQMLASVMNGPLFQNSAARKSAPLPDAGTIGTDAAYMGFHDGAGQSTKARPQMLAQEEPTKAKAQNVWQQIGTLSPSAAANQAMRRSDDHGYKALPQMLFDVDGPQSTDPSYSE